MVQIHDDYTEDIDENAARVKEILTKARKRRKAAAKPAAAQQKSYAPQLYPAAFFYKLPRPKI